MQKVELQTKNKLIQSNGFICYEVLFEMVSPSVSRVRKNLAVLISSYFWLSENTCENYCTTVPLETRNFCEALSSDDQSAWLEPNHEKNCYWTCMNKTI